MYSGPFGPVGPLLQIIAVLGSFIFGFYNFPAIPTILACGCVLTIAWGLIRLPHLIGIWKTDGIQIWRLIPIQITLSSILASVVYGAGFGVHWLVKKVA